MNVETLEKFCKNVSRTFFYEFGLISHQINSFNSPSDYLDVLSLCRASIDRTGEGRHTTIACGKVWLDKPSFWIKRSDQKEGCQKTVAQACSTSKYDIFF